MFARGVDDDCPCASAFAGIEPRDVARDPPRHSGLGNREGNCPLDAALVFEVFGLASVGRSVADILPAAYAVVFVQVGVLQAYVGACGDGNFRCLGLRDDAEHFGHAYRREYAQDDDDDHYFDECKTVLFQHKKTPSRNRRKAGCKKNIMFEGGRGLGGRKKYSVLPYSKLE